MCLQGHRHGFAPHQPGIAYKLDRVAISMQAPDHNAFTSEWVAIPKRVRVGLAGRRDSFAHAPRLFETPQQHPARPLVSGALPGIRTLLACQTQQLEARTDRSV